jgi:hypothetical protein
VVAKAYWVTQAAFVVMLLGLSSSPALQYIPLALLAVGIAAIQFALVSWRLWISRSHLWVAFVPLFSNTALWLGLQPWVAEEVAGDGRGFIAGFAYLAWGVISYVGVGVWAGVQRTSERALNKG